MLGCPPNVMATMTRLGARPHGAPAPNPRRVPKIGLLELGVLAAFLAVSVWVLGLDLLHAASGNGVWTGSDSLYGVDQFQYLAWIRDSSRHLLVSNLFVLRATPSDYFQPAIALSGGLAALGLSPTIALLLWKPVAVVAIFFTTRAYLSRTLADRNAQLAALALSLFFGSFTVVYGSVGAIGDLFPGFLTWGYPFALLGLAAMVAGLLSYNRARDRGTVSWWPGVFGLAAGLLHPWHGALLIAAVLGAELVMLRGLPTVRQLILPAITTAITALPLSYYVLLGHVDLSWRLARAASKHTYPLWAIVLELVPLLLPAALVYRRPPRDFLNATAMVWPVAAFVLFVLSTTRFAATPVHAFQGITIPLSVLAVRGAQSVGFRRLPRPAIWGTVLVAAFTIPATMWELNTARRAVSPRVGDSNLITRDEDDALHYLARDPGPVA